MVSFLFFANLGRSENKEREAGGQQGGNGSENPLTQGKQLGGGGLSWWHTVVVISPNTWDVFRIRTQCQNIEVNNKIKSY